MDIDVVGGTDGTHTVIGIDLAVGSADTNYGMKISGGSILLQEQADAAADIAGYGQIWVNTATANELFFTDDTGVDHLIQNTDALGNITVGVGAGTGGSFTGVSNILVGCDTGDAVTTGKCNIAIGCDALGAATTSCFNIAIGQSALGGGTLACGGSGQAEENIAIGSLSADALTTGSNNIAIGKESLSSATTSGNNIAIGCRALFASVDDGENNVAIGKGAMGATDVSGDHNIALGNDAANAVTSGAGGTISQIQYHSASGTVGGADVFWYDYTNDRIGIGTQFPEVIFEVVGSSKFSETTETKNLVPMLEGRSSILSLIHI